MDWDDLLSLITLGAVFPYVSTAAASWFRGHDARHPAAPDLVRMHQGDALSQ